jgi:uncharacterized repeat protein (TIGR04138 family)
MQPLTFEQSVEKIVATDTRYDSEAYFFMRDGLQFARRNRGRFEYQGRDFITVQVLDGLRRYALETYGPMAAAVLAEWGVHRCEDFGEILSNMVAHHCEIGAISGHHEDFKHGYSFNEAFRKPFLPSARRAAPPRTVEAFPLKNPTE